MLITTRRLFYRGEIKPLNPGTGPGTVTIESDGIDFNIGTYEQIWVSGIPQPHSTPLSTTPDFPKCDATVGYDLKRFTRHALHVLRHLDIRNWATPVLTITAPFLNEVWKIHDDEEEDARLQFQKAGVTLGNCKSNLMKWLRNITKDAPPAEHSLPDFPHEELYSLSFVVFISTDSAKIRVYWEGDDEMYHEPTGNALPVLYEAELWKFNLLTEEGIISFGQRHQCVLDWATTEYLPRLEELVERVPVEVVESSLKKLHTAIESESFFWGAQV